MYHQIGSVRAEGAHLHAGCGLAFELAVADPCLRADRHWRRRHDRIDCDGTVFKTEPADYRQVGVDREDRRLRAAGQYRQCASPGEAGENDWIDCAS